MAIKRKMGFAEIKPAKMDIYEPFMTEFDIPYRIVIGSGEGMRHIKSKKEPGFLIKECPHPFRRAEK